MNHQINFKIKECKDCYIGQVIISAVDFYNRRSFYPVSIMDKIHLIKFKVCILKNNEIDEIFKTLSKNNELNLTLIIQDNNVKIRYFNINRALLGRDYLIFWNRLNYYFKDIEYYNNNIQTIKEFNFNYAFKTGQFVLSEILDRKSLSWRMDSYNSHRDLKKILILINKNRRINEDEAK